MHRYRLFLMENAKVAEEREFPATDDTVAEQLAEGWRSRRTAELWRGPFMATHS